MIAIECRSAAGKWFSLMGMQPGITAIGRIIRQGPAEHAHHRRAMPSPIETSTKPAPRNGQGRSICKASRKCTGAKTKRKIARRMRVIIWSLKQRVRSTPPAGCPRFSGKQDIWIDGVLSRIKGLASGWMGLKWVDRLSFGNYGSPLCSPTISCANSQSVIDSMTMSAPSPE